MILDEATSAMDIVTDQKMTSLVQSEFSACTVVTIAHRLNTVLSCDRSLVSSPHHSNIFILQSLCDGRREDPL